MMSGLIQENCILFDIKGEKEQVIRTLAECLYKAGKVEDAEGFYQDVLEREKVSPTYIGYAMGLPHGKTDRVLEPGVCFGRMEAPVVWNEQTGEKADLAILIAVPAEEAGNTHMKILASLSRRLMHESFRESLKTSDRDQVYRILKEVLEG